MIFLTLETCSLVNLSLRQFCKFYILPVGISSTKHGCTASSCLLHPLMTNFDLTCFCRNMFCKDEEKQHVLTIPRFQCASFHDIMTGLGACWSISVVYWTWTSMKFTNFHNQQTSASQSSPNLSVVLDRSFGSVKSRKKL